jgi:hypothetical protein
MKRYPLLFILLFVLVAGVMLSSSVLAGEKCCVRNDRGVCVPCPDKGTSASATTAGAQQQACCPSGTASKTVRSHSDHGNRPTHNRLPCRMTGRSVPVKSVFHANRVKSATANPANRESAG